MQYKLNPNMNKDTFYKPVVRVEKLFQTLNQLNQRLHKIIHCFEHSKHLKPLKTV